MRRVLWLLSGLLILVLVAMPWLRSAEHADLEAARAQAPGAFVTLQHGKVFYRVAGPADGAPVILVHGFSVPDYIFDGTRRHLADAGFRVVSFDLYGRGWSDRPDVVYDRDLFAGQLSQLMDALHIQRASLVGISMGGAVVGHFAAAHAERVDKLVLIDPFTQPIDIGPMRWPVIGDWLFYSYYLPHLAETQLDGASHPEHFADWPKQFAAQMRYPHFGRALLSTGRHLIGQSSLPDFTQVGRQNIPTLLVWGRRDETVPFALSAQVLQAIPSAKLLAIDDAGHIANVERPDIVDPAIATFLTAPAVAMTPR